MNIFVLSYVPNLSATMHMDAHVRKMVVEYTQMMSTAVQYHVGYRIDGLYKPCYVNNRYNKWVRASRGNFDWLFHQTKTLFDEYIFRFGTFHLSEQIFLNAWNYREVIPIGNRTPFALPNGYEYSSTVHAYRRYYREKKSHLAVWTKREMPYWWEGYHVNSID